jgi:methionyl-tRNA formyltransferase
VAAVVTQPERPRGRRLQPGPCPIKAYADQRGIPVLAPERVGATASLEEFRRLAPDLIVVADYGQYIKPEILALPRFEAINLHPSLLPKYRGAAPIQMAIANGETETGVTILCVSRELDAGDILLQRTVPIDDQDDALSLATTLAALGAELVMEAIEQIRLGTAHRRPQDHAQATYVPKLTKEDGRIDWNLPASTLRNRIRGFVPWPGCFCMAAPDSDTRLKVWTADVEPGRGEPGTVLAADDRGPLVAAGRDALRLTEVQPEGGKRMPGPAYLNGYHVRVGHRFG